MSTNLRQADPVIAVSASSNPAAIATPTPDQELRWVKRFPARLKTTARWVKQFLHSGR